MAEIYCKRCLHHEDLGRAVRHDEKCPACGAGVFRRVGKAPRPHTHFPAVLRAIFSVRGIFFLLAFALVGTAPIGVLASVSVIMLFLGSLKLALRAMNVGSDGKIDFPEVSPEELFDKAALIPSIAFVLFFVWAPPILTAYAASGIFSFDLTPSVTDFQKPKAGAAVPGGLDALAHPDPAQLDPKQLDPKLLDAMKQMGVSPDALKAELEKAQKEAKSGADDDGAGMTLPIKAHNHMDAPRVIALAFAAFLFLWAPMALVLFLRTSSTLAMFHVPAGVRTVRNDPGGYFVLCLFVLPALAARFGADLVTAALPFFITPPILLVKGAVVLFAWALCGLYVRQHARAFDLPVDDADWVANERAPVRETRLGREAAVVKGTLIT